MKMKIVPVKAPVQFDGPQLDWVGLQSRDVIFKRPRLEAQLIEVTELIRATAGRSQFDVDGKGLTVAILDSGINSEHVDFKGKLLAQQNFTTDNSGNSTDARDGMGHGTNVSGIVCAFCDHIGIAPGANIVAVKVIGDNGSGGFDEINAGLKWVIDNRLKFNISVVCMSMGDQNNYITDTDHLSLETTLLIAKLHELKVAVVISSGNGYFQHRGRQGMSYPGIVRQAVSVGAVFDANVGSRSYENGAIAYSTSADRITPFSQRLHPSLSPDCSTDIFAPGASVTSSGINGPHGVSTQDGTSQAAPVVAGVILLMQQYFIRHTNVLPQVPLLVEWMRKGGKPVFDGDDENDNVTHSGKEYLRVDVPGAIDAIRNFLELKMLVANKPMSNIIW